MNADRKREGVLVSTILSIIQIVLTTPVIMTFFCFALFFDKAQYTYFYFGKDPGELYSTITQSFVYVIVGIMFLLLLVLISAVLVMVQRRAAAIGAIGMAGFASIFFLFITGFFVLYYARDPNNPNDPNNIAADLRRCCVPSIAANPSAGCPNYNNGTPTACAQSLTVDQLGTNMAFIIFCCTTSVACVLGAFIAFTAYFAIEKDGAGDLFANLLIGSRVGNWVEKTFGIKMKRRSKMSKHEYEGTSLVGGEESGSDDEGKP